MYTDDGNKQEKIGNSNNTVDNSYYGNYYDNNRVEQYDDQKGSNKNKWIIIIIIIILLLLLGGLIFFLVRGGQNNDDNNNNNDDNNNKPEPSIVWLAESLQLKVSETKKIEYSIVNDDGKITINWSSNDKKIASVTGDGKVTALKVGNTKIIASYFINNVPHEKQFAVTVIKNNSSTGSGGNSGSGNTGSSGGNSGSGNSGSSGGNSGTTNKDNEKPTLTYSLSNGGGDQWTNKAVTINVNAKDNSGTVNVKYALDCTTSNCNYQTVKDNKITIDKDGVTIVKIVASDGNNNSKEAIVNVKIDKSKPIVAFSPGDGTYAVGQTVKVTPSDSKSGISSYNVLISYANDREVLNVSNITSPSYSYQFKEPGIYYFYIRAFDKAGNMCDVRSGNQWWYYQIYTITNNGGTGGSKPPTSCTPYTKTLIGSDTSSCTVSGTPGVDNTYYTRENARTRYNYTRGSWRCGLNNYPQTSSLYIYTSSASAMSACNSWSCSSGDIDRVPSCTSASRVLYDCYKYTRTCS